jgi:ParB family chromosome partitioning protein
MARRSGLGRGLEALIPGSERPSDGIQPIPIEHIAPNPLQPRSKFDPGELDELAASIKEHGILQPLIVTYNDETGQYTLIAGERRLLAARQIGLQAVPAIVKEVSDQQRLEMALIENVQRADLAPLEAAQAYRQLSEDFNLSHEQISKRVGKSRVAITNTLRLLNLPPTVKKTLAEGQISEGHARALLALPTHQAQTAVLDSILSKGLSVRQTENLIRKLRGEKNKPHTKSEHPPEITNLEARLRSHLSTKVNVNPKKKGGTVVIHYYSDEELNAIIDMILGDYG